MPNYCFAGLNYELIADYISEFSRLSPFLTSNDKGPDVRAELRGLDSIKMPFGIQLLNDYIKPDLRMILLIRPDSNISVYLERESTMTFVSGLETDPNWKSSIITYLKSEPYFGHYALGILGSLIIKNRIIMYDGLAVHASAIKQDGRGIIFAAPSGTGKSTHAKLWEDNFGARILNDDCPVLRLIDGRPFVFGTPWSGSSDKFENSSAPLSGIVILEQSHDNKIYRLNSSEIIQKLLPRCFLPYYDKVLMSMGINTFDRIVSSTPVYLLECTPEKEAMELVYQWVK